jgi:hypothetical protein
MSDDPMRHASTHGILGGPEQIVARCPVTGRRYEDGSGALPHEEQTAMFIRDAAIKADTPTDSGFPHHIRPRCPQTNREYECGPGAGTRAQQTARFLEELPDDLKALRRADFEKLRDTPTAGRA